MGAFGKIVVGSDGSDAANRAVAWSSVQTHLTSLTVVHGFPPAATLFAAAAQVNLDDERARHLHLLQTEWSEPARAAGVPVTAELIDDDPPSALQFVAERIGADLVAIGVDSDRGWGRSRVGHKVEHIVQRATTPVAVTNDETPMTPVRGTVVVALTGPAEAELDWARRVATELDLPLHLVTSDRLWANHEPKASDDAKLSARDGLDVSIRHLASEDPGIRCTAEIIEGHPVDALERVARQTEASLVVTAAHHPHHISWLFGRSLLQYAPLVLPCPTIAVPQPSGSEAAVFGAGDRALGEPA